jgi:surfeit locus 1 family protein
LAASDPQTIPGGAPGGAPSEATARKLPPPPWRRILAFGLLCGPVFLFLVGLGVWQINRLAWKEAILASIARAEQAPPAPLPAAPSPFEKVFVTGTPDPHSLSLFGDDVRTTATGDTVNGGELLVVLRRAGAAPVLVDLGWIPYDAFGRATLPATLSVSGFAQAPERANTFTPKDDPADRQFYLLDPARIGPELGVPHLAPFVLVAMGAPPARGWPEPAANLPRPPNDHLQYALTWFGLAGVLLAQFLYWSFKVFRP